MDRVAPDELTASGVSWAAVVGGAFVAAAMALILLSLGAGLGLSSVSPWSNAGASAVVIGAASVIWLIVAQIMAFGLGGYVAGRLRIKWTTVHSDEVYFRDTAHGLLVWAVAAVVTAGVLAGAATSMAGAARSGESARSGGGEVTSAESADPTAYAIDGMFRSGRVTADRADVDSLVASRTGLNQSDADQRVTRVFADLQQAIDTARSRAAKLSLWIFVALLTGAFCASYAATIGGRQRDHVVHI